MATADIGIKVIMEDAASAGLYNINSQLGRMGTLGRQAATGLTAMDAAFLGVFAGAAAALAIFGGLIVFAVKQFSEMQQAFLKVQIAAGLTGAQMKDLGNFMVAVGAQSIYSLSQLADGMAIVAQFGFKTVASLKEVTAAGINLGEALNTTPTVAFQLLAQTMRAFSIPAAQAQRTADMLFYSFQHGTNNISQLESGLGQVAGTATTLGIHLGDLIPAFDVLAPIMGSAANAGTSLRYALARLADPTATQAAEQKKLGISLYDSTGRFIGFNQAVQLLYNTLKDKTPQEQFQALSTLLTVRGAQAFMLLISHMKDYDKAVAAFNASNQGAGQSASAAARVMETLSAQWKVFTSNVKDAAAFIGATLAPAISSLLGWINRAVAQLRVWTQANGDLASKFLLIGAAIAGVTLLVLFFMTGIGEVVGIILLVIAGVAALAAGIMILVHWFQQALSSATPLGKFLRELGTIFSGFGVVVHTLWNLFVSQLMPALQQLGSQFQALKVAITPYIPLLEMLGKILLGVVLFAILAVIIVLGSLVIALVKAATFVAYFITQLLNGFVEAKNKIGTIFSAIGTIISTTLNWIQVHIGGFINTVINFFGMLLNVLVGGSIVPNLMNRMFSIFVGGFNRILGALGGWVNNVVGWFGQLPGRILGIISGLGGSLFGAAQGWMFSLANGAWSAFQAAAAPFFALANTIAGLWPHSPPKWGPLVGYEKWMPTMLAEMAKGVKQGAPQLQMAFYGAASNLTNIPSFVGSTGGGTGQPMVIQLVLDNRVIGQASLNYQNGLFQLQGLGRTLR